MIVNGIEIGEIDVETGGAIIEVTTMKAGKADQISRMSNDPGLNPLGKPVILYAPRYSRNAERDVVKEGGCVVRDKQELVELLEKLKKRSN